MLDIKYAKTLLDYNPETGLFTRTVDCSSRARKGDVAGYFDKSNGYRYVSIGGISYYEHRLAWAFIFGVMPEFEIDHKNGIRNDNRIENLRQATKKENACNKQVRHGIKSGVKGVTWHAKAGKWMAQIAKDKKHYYLGLFEDIDSASKAYQKAASELHGSFASF